MKIEKMREMTEVELVNELKKMKNELFNTLQFVERNFQNGFRKSVTSKSIPRVRFESIAVGCNLALRENSNLTVTNVVWVDSNEFKQWTTSDAANSKSKVTGRIEFVKDCLTGIQDLTELTYDN